jgi:glycosyltransferase involved in cell wall biosynthesis
MPRAQSDPGRESPVRIAVIANMIDPQRASIFELAANRGDCQLFVVYETAVEPNRDWGAVTVDFPHEVLDSKTLNLERFGTDAYVHVARPPLASIKRFRPDVVIGGGGGVWASPSNVAALATRNRNNWAFVPWWGSFPRPRPTLPRRALDPWVRYYVGAGDAWIAYGSRAAREVVRLGAHSDGVVIVPNVSRAPAEVGSLDADRPAGVRFLFVGQLIERKGMHELLAAFSHLSSGELWIAGDGRLRPNVELAARHNSNVRPLGHLSWDELQIAYRSVDVLVLPSRYEVWGLVVNEALEHGLPVIVSDQVGAADDLVEPGTNGVVVPAGDVASLSRALRDVARWSPERRLIAGRESEARMAAWSRERAAEALVEVSRMAMRRRERTG